jgi:YtkA-like protein
MKTELSRLSLTVLLLATTSALALARPIDVKSVGGVRQQVVMCPKCGTPIACAKVGDFTLAFTAELREPEELRWVRLTVRVTDKAGAAVNDAKVSFAAWMTGHWHELTPPLQAENQGKGLYTTATTGRLAMRGTWFVEVQMTTRTGDMVKQLYTLTMPPG